MTQIDLSQLLKLKETQVSSTSLGIFGILFCSTGDNFQGDIMESLEAAMNRKVKAIHTCFLIYGGTGKGIGKEMLAQPKPGLHWQGCRQGKHKMESTILKQIVTFNNFIFVALFLLLMPRKLLLHCGNWNWVVHWVIYLSEEHSASRLVFYHRTLLLRKRARWMF